MRHTVCMPASQTGISWATHTWNCITGCTPCSEACSRCYARRLSERYQRNPRLKGKYRNGFEVTLHWDELNVPARWRTSKRVFVNSMSDTFHEKVPLDFIERIVNAVAFRQDSIFFFLTKRPERMKEFFDWYTGLYPGSAQEIMERNLGNLWLGVTTENQRRADERIPVLLDTPAAHRFISCEPLLREVNVRPYLGPGKIEWVICGGESGPRFRPMKPIWARELLNQCLLADARFHFKQHSGYRPGKDPYLGGIVGGGIVGGVEFKDAPPFEEDSP